MTTTPTPKAVEALAMAIYCHSPDDEMPVGLIREMAAKACIERLYSLGYTITRAEPAPLPDEVEKCLIELETFANKQMEREFLTTGGSSFAGWMPTSSEFVDTIRAHIAALEAENKKLINAITHAIAMLEIDAEADYAVDFTCTINILNEALSQTVAAQKQPEVSDKAVCGYQVSDKQHEPQKCGTCGGNGIEKYRMKTWNRELKKYEWNKCPDCNGTGKAGE